MKLPLPVDNGAIRTHGYDRRAFFMACLLVTTACQPDTSPPPTSAASPTTVSATVPGVTGTTAPPETTVPGVEVEVVAPCEAADEPLVAAAAVPLGGEMLASEEAVWISSFAAGGLIRVEPSTLCPDDPIEVTSAPFGSATLTLAADGTLYAAAARSGEIAVVSHDDISDFPAQVNGAGGLAAADGRLWAVCCDPSQPTTGRSGIFDLASGEILAEIPIESGREIEVDGDVAWIGRADTGGIHRVTVQGDTVEVESFEGLGTATSSLADTDDGVYLVTDQPVLQRLSGESIEQVTDLPFPPDHPIDLEAGPDGSLYAVGPYGPGVIWVTPEGEVLTVLGAETLVQVEVVGETLWVLGNDGTLIRIDTGILGDN